MKSTFLSDLVRDTFLTRFVKSHGQTIVNWWSNHVILNSTNKFLNIATFYQFWWRNQYPTFERDKNFAFDTYLAHFFSHCVIFQTQPRIFSTQLLNVCLRFSGGKKRTWQKITHILAEQVWSLTYTYLFVINLLLSFTPSDIKGCENIRGVNNGTYTDRSTGSPSSKHEHRRTSALLRSIRR